MEACLVALGPMRAQRGAWRSTAGAYTVVAWRASTERAASRVAAAKGSAVRNVVGGWWVARAGRLLDVAGPGGARAVVVRCAERGVVARLRLHRHHTGHAAGAHVDVACTVRAPHPPMCSASRALTVGDAKHLGCAACASCAAGAGGGRLRRGGRDGRRQLVLRRLPGVGAVARARGRSSARGGRQRRGGRPAPGRAVELPARRCVAL